MTPSSGIDLPALLRPIEAQTFLREYLDQKPLVLSRNNPGYYCGLPTLDDVDQILSQHQLGKSIVVTRKDGAPIPIVDEAGFVHTSVLYRSFGDLGNTVIINAIDCHSTPVALLCRNVMIALQRPVGCNLYLTPKGAQGFDAHFDNHDVFVLQVVGRKTWRIYPAAVELPLDGANFAAGLSPRLGASPEARARLGEPLHEVCLEPGDLLYLPRGFVHEAWTTADVSMHLTMSIAHDRWVDLVDGVVRLAAARRVSLRRAVPVGVYTDPALRAATRSQIREFLLELARSADVDEVLDQMEESFVAKMVPLPDRHLAKVGEIDRIDLDTVVQHRPGTACRVAAEGGVAVIQFPGGRMTGPLKILTALRFIAETPEFAVRQIEGGAEGDKLLLDLVLAHDPTRCPLLDSSKLLLVRRLVALGLLTPTH